MDFEMVTNPDSPPFNWTCEEFSGFECMPDSTIFHTGTYSAKLQSIFSTYSVYNDSIDLEIGYLERVIPFNTDFRNTKTYNVIYTSDNPPVS